MSKLPGIPLVWRPKGLTDAADGSNAFPGAMQSLSNLIPDPSTADVWMPRPPAIVATSFPGFASPTFVSALLVIGNLAYGMVSDSGGKDTPFVYDIAADTFQTITGVTSGNKPTSPATSGDWVPPIMAQVAGRIIVTHPGFPGGATKFGWFDISGFSSATLGDTVNGSPVITGSPAILGVQPGMAIAAASGIPAATTVLSVANAYTAFSVEADSHTSATLDGIADTTGMLIGMFVTGPGVQSGTTIAGVLSGTSILLSRPTTTSETNGTFVVTAATATSAAGTYTGTLAAGNATITIASTVGLHVGQSIVGTGIPAGSTIVTVVGGAIQISQFATADGDQQFQVTGSVIVMSANATVTNDGEPLTITGGSVGAPQWGAGDTYPNNLPSQPVGVAQMNGRAYFVCGTDGVVFSDSGLPCQISNSPRVQALTTNDGLPCTAIGPVTLASLMGGIVQSLIVFEGEARMQQITGDMATNNLAMNALPAATGTAAPLTISTCEVGLAFVSPEGLRFIDFTGRVSHPVGDAGQGITVPFIYALNPSRMCAAANAHVVRITVHNGNKPTTPWEEYWYDIGRKTWSGPHTSTASMIQAWADEFIMTFVPA